MIPGIPPQINIRRKAQRLSIIFYAHPSGDPRVEGGGGALRSVREPRISDALLLFTPYYDYVVRAVCRVEYV